MTTNLQWVGHACFRLWQDGGPAVVMDPYNPSEIARACGTDRSVFELEQLHAETVVVSSLTDKAHAYYQAVEGSPEVINALDVAQGKIQPKINEESIVAVQAAEAPHHPDGPDDNALYAFKSGTLWFLHMGDLGYGIYEDELKPFNHRCDVLLALVGEGLTVSLDELDKMIDILKPTWIVPMHYECPPLAANMTGLEVFLKRRSRDPIIHVRHHTVKFPLSTEGLLSPTLVVLEPSGFEAEKLF